MKIHKVTITRTIIVATNNKKSIRRLALEGAKETDHLPPDGLHIQEIETALEIPRGWKNARPFTDDDFDYRTVSEIILDNP